jgi:hypothetical protein
MCAANEEEADTSWIVNASYIIENFGRNSVRIQGSVFYTRMPKAEMIGQKLLQLWWWVFLKARTVADNPDSQKLCTNKSDRSS